MWDKRIFLGGDLENMAGGRGEVEGGGTQHDSALLHDAQSSCVWSLHHRTERVNSRSEPLHRGHCGPGEAAVT